MNVWGVLSVMWRRWYVFVPLLALAASVAFIVPKDSKASYTVESLLLLQAPTSEHAGPPGSTDTVIKPVNPLLVNSGGLAPSASLLSRVMVSSAIQTAVFNAGYKGAYQVIATDRQPLLTIDTTDADVAVAKNGNHTVFDLMSAEINKRQGTTASDPTQKVTLAYVTQDEVRVSETSKYRAAAVLLIAGLLVSVTATIVVDVLVSRRGRRRAPRSRAAAAAEVGARS